MSSAEISDAAAHQIVVLNCNTNSVLTRSLEAIARLAASPGSTVVGLTPPFGPESAEGYYESMISATAMFAALEKYPEPFDAVVLAGFGEHGREGMRQRWEVPVVDITEAGPILANLVAHRYGVVTTLSSTVPVIWESLRNAGLHTRCIGVEASEIPVSSIHTDIAEVAGALESRARQLVSRGAEAIVLGCAGFAGLDLELGRRLGIPVIDGVPAGVRLAEALLSAGMSTSKAHAFSPLNPAKRWKGWPPAASTEQMHLDPARVS
ncbi:aspartate/glutamate racemase family protein [Nesterenkonia alkaliphila]|uniref:aspartate/glutamate racemase family protein n=1 Tax=Nesterenkonia alkaliphila TaxID=1463631 RepID=UPI00166BD445|nr:aspartate/glutamate racemase family protein [Nesterenkonia alkaliphila]GFZ76874.1 Asp/Glu/hydantoin racemase [Nesterenkonia alkaliphila]